MYDRRIELMLPSRRGHNANPKPDGRKKKQRTEAPIMRNQLIDQYGFVQELQKRFADPLKDRIKKDMELKGEKLAEGDHFEAVLFGGDSSFIDATKFFCLFERGKLTRAQLVNCLRVSKDAAKEYLSGAEIERISITAPKDKSLTVRHKKGVEPSLIESVKNVSAQIEANARNADPI